MPSMLGAMILLFGNAFAAYATAYSLTSGRSNIVPILIGAYYTRQRARQPAPRAGARVRHVRRARGDDADLHPAAAARRRGGRSEAAAASRRARVIWLLLGGAVLLHPAGRDARSSASSRTQTGKCCTLHNYSWVIHNGDFWHTLKISFLLALETIVISLLLFVPTIYWVHLKLPRLRPVIAFLALIPFVVPPIVMVVGLLRRLQGHAALVLRAAVGLPRGGVRDPRVPVHVLLARRRLPLDRRAHADRGVAEPRRELADDALQGDPPEHPRGRARRRRS